jgi:hypothetical protein
MLVVRPTGEGIFWLSACATFESLEYQERCDKESSFERNEFSQPTFAPNGQHGFSERCELTLLILPTLSEDRSLEQ